jgi:hypothetical protein
MAAAAYAEGKEQEPSPMITAAIQHGAADRAEYLEQPADLAGKMRTLNYVYRCWKGYLAAGAQQQTVPWTQQHPDEWQTVTKVMQMRREMKRGL